MVRHSFLHQTSAKTISHLLIYFTLHSIYSPNFLILTPEEKSLKKPPCFSNAGPLDPLDVPSFRRLLSISYSYRSTVKPFTSLVAFLARIHTSLHHPLVLVLFGPKPDLHQLRHASTKPIVFFSQKKVWFSNFHWSLVLSNCKSWQYTLLSEIVDYINFPIYYE